MYEFVIFPSDVHLNCQKKKEKSTQTRLLKNNGKYFSDESINKIKETTYSRYGVDSFTKTKMFKDAISAQQLNNNNFFNTCSPCYIF